MAYIKIDNVSFQYPDSSHHALNQVSFTIEEGEFIVIAGPSGCGKTTLLKLLKKELTPVGELSGKITYKGMPLESVAEKTSSQEIGFVFQNPENQIVMEDVLSELVFGMENLGVNSEEMRQRVAEMVHFFGLASLLQADTHTLSGGQKQLINLASVLLLKPKLLLLDEPTSQLDPVQSKEFLQFLKRLNEEFGITILLVEHRLEELYSIADRVVLLTEGSLQYIGTAKSVIHQVWTEKDERFLPYLPSVSKLFYYVQSSGFALNEVPITVKEAHKWLHQLQEIEGSEPDTPPANPDRKISLQCKQIHYKYNKDDAYVLKNLSLNVYEGDYLAIVGGNGSGKSTLLKCCTAIIKPIKGTVLLKGKKIRTYKKADLEREIGYLPQNPLLCFMAETLEEELMNLAARFPISNPKERIASLTKQLGIDHILLKHIHDCSGGEQQKAALATILFSSPNVLLIDEPTKGMDPVSKQQFAEMLKELHEKGMTIIMVTHDIEFAASHVNRCLMLFDGMITVDGRTEQVLKGNYFYTTAINRVTRDTHVPEILTLEEACAAWRLPVQS
ncbi:ABC transporter ATP-binding protein [Neobacillus sp. NPDC058068]|uniref:ABC transporter ATP-binding protein n=1 Tax=Neobacillus sp. NPDC058068 TaxID=3346325 RepID=UPI0036D96E16